MRLLEPSKGFPTQCSPKLLTPHDAPMHSPISALPVVLYASSHIALLPCIALLCPKHSTLCVSYAGEALQSALHVEAGGAFGSGRCDRIGCFARTGGGNAPPERKEAFGPGKRIDTSFPFELRASADGKGTGGVTVRLYQEGKEVTVFDQSIAGNPQGSSVPASAAIATAAAIEATGGLALVASLWTAVRLASSMLLL